MRSLERRLQLGLGLSLVVLLGLLWWASAVAARQLTEHFMLSRLQHDAEQILAAFAMGWHGRGNNGTKLERIPPVYQKVYSGHYYAVRLPNGSVQRSRSLWDRELQVPDLATGQHRMLHAAGPEGQQLLVWTAAYSRQHEGGGEPLVVTVAEDLSPLQTEIGRFQWVLAGLMLVAVVVLLSVQQMILRRSFRRLDPVREDIRRLAEGQIGALREDVPSEILPLVRELNRLLGLLGRRLERSRHALGNLAHALKAPLSLLTQDLDAADQTLDRQLLQGQAERIRALIERELRRARLAGTGQAGRRFAPGRDIPDLIDALRRMHGTRPLDLAFDDRTQGPLQLDREDLLELLGNLLDNACKWAGGRVRIAAAEEAGVLRVSVEDDGPGVSDDLIEGLTLRGVRADESVSGHGLGLAIAKDIVQLYGGAIGFSRSPSLGGLRVELTIPLRTADLIEA